MKYNEIHNSNHKSPKSRLDFKSRQPKLLVSDPSFQAHWFGKWRWLHYDSCRDLAFCHTCVTALKTGKLISLKGNVKDSAFLYNGFCNWKDATIGFENHEECTTHKKAVETVITLPRTTRDVGELISSAHAAKIGNQCLVTITESIRFLARQGIALRGDGDERNSNFVQLLHVRAIDQPQLLSWLERKTDKYMSPQIQNEILTTMATTVLRNISEAIQKASYFSIMADEVTDSANKEQVVVCFRIVDEHFDAHEEFVGLYQVDSIVSSSIVEVLKDTILRLNLAISSCRGQCYDGAANMAGIRNGVAAQMPAEEPRAMYTHCYGHVLNLAASDTVKKNKVLRDVLDTLLEITKLLKFSPKREAHFTKLKQEISPGTPGFCTMCPTRWTVSAASLKSVIDYYLVFQALWEEVKDTVGDSEIRARVIGVSATMSRFDFLFGLVLAEKLLQHTDNLSKTLQAPPLTASKGQQVSDLTCTSLGRIQNSEAFDLFWDRLQVLQKEYGVDEARLP